MLSGLAQGLLKKLFESRFKGNTVDVQIFNCYNYIFKRIYKDETFLASVHEMANCMLEGVKYFDKTGNAENMYISMCIFCNRILTKREYYFYADRFLKNVVAYNELLAYLDFNSFRTNIMKDIDIEKINVPKTKLMIYLDVDALHEHMNSIYKKRRVVYLQNKDSGTHTIPNISQYRLDLNKKLYIHCIDPQLEVTELPENNITLDPQTGDLTLKLPKRCTVYISNQPLVKKDL